MRRLNEYSEDIFLYNQSHGTDIFMEYKLPTTSPERKKEIEDWLFNLLRTKDIIPVPTLDENASERDLIALSNLDSYKVYDQASGFINTQAVGVTFLNRFFREELCHITKPSNPRSVYDHFHHDHSLRRTVRKALQFTEDESGIYRWIILSGAGYCTPFRPAAAKALYEILGTPTNCRVLDTSSGFGGRLLGAHFAQNVIEYLGTDPNTQPSFTPLIEYLDQPKFNTHTKKEVLRVGSEDLTPQNFPHLQHYFDMSFTSPPYFNTEMYSTDPTQSYIKFPTYALWCKGFLQKTIDNTCNLLKPTGVFALNIFEKTPNIKEIIRYFLLKNGWVLYRTDAYLLRTMPGRSKDSEGKTITRPRHKTYNKESVFIAKHYTQLYREGVITKEQASKFHEQHLTIKKRAEIESR